MTGGDLDSVQVRVPGRVNIIGEHIDYAGGLVLPTPIDRCVIVDASVSDGGVEIDAAGFGQQRWQPGNPLPGNWSDYVIAAHQEAISMGLLKSGAIYSIKSDIPHGAGVSSSAALIIAILSAATTLSASKVEPVEIAKAARRVETDRLGVPCGIMDQMAIAVGQPGHALALYTDRLSYEQVRLITGTSLIVIHSGLTRQLSEGAYATRAEAVAKAAEFLGTPYLALADVSRLGTLSEAHPDLVPYTRHVITEHQRSITALQALRDQDAKALGGLMNASHHSLRDDFTVVPPEMDAMCSVALEAGAYGARLTGGGFGGCIVILARTEDATPIQQAVITTRPEARLISQIDALPS